MLNRAIEKVLLLRSRSRDFSAASRQAQGCSREEQSIQGVVFHLLDSSLQI